MSGFEARISSATFTALSPSGMILATRKMPKIAKLIINGQRNITVTPCRRHCMLASRVLRAAKKRGSVPLPMPPSTFASPALSPVSSASASALKYKSNAAS